jgi:hypothetical protein
MHTSCAGLCSHAVHHAGLLHEANHAGLPLMPPTPTPGCLLTVRTRPAEEAKKELSAEYVADQKAVDAALLKALTPGRLMETRNSLAKPTGFVSMKPISVPVQAYWQSQTASWHSVVAHMAAWHCVGGSPTDAVHKPWAACRDVCAWLLMILVPVSGRGVVSRFVHEITTRMLSQRADLCADS